jgi:aryl sulfotransferase
MKMIGKVVLAVAVVLGGIGRYDPTLFFYIPHIGFVFHLLTTGKMPPFFVYDAWTPQSNFQSWIKPNDVVVATGSKSGTNWMLYCSHQIRMHESLEQADELWEDVNYATPWPSWRQNPGMSWAEEAQLYNTSSSPSTGKPLKHYWDNPLYPFRVFKSHEYPIEAGGVLHIKENPNVKFVAMVRNPVDVTLSFMTFMNKHTPTLRHMLGGFPPKFSVKSSFEEEVDAILHFLHSKNGRKDKQLSMFAYTNGWWPLRNEPNVLLLHYSDAIQDLSGTVSQLSKFYDIDLTEEQHTTVVQRCGIDHMKTLDKRGAFSYKLPLNKRFGEFSIMVKEGGMIHKGGSRGKQLFTQAQQDFIHGVEEEEFGYDPELLRWTREGGGFS